MGSKSVKVVNAKQEAKELSKFTGDKINKKIYKNIVNEHSTLATKEIKSGQAAKGVARWRENQNLSIPKKPTVKVNSNPMRGK
jgi:hypothetical protein